jgi:hypothetical protein
MHVKMIHLLPTDPTRIDDHTKTVCRPLFARQTPCMRKDFAKHCLMRIVAFGKRGNVLLRDNKEMDGRAGMYVVEREDLGIFKHLF